MAFGNVTLCKVEKKIRSVDEKRVEYMNMIKIMIKCSILFKDFHY